MVLPTEYFSYFEGLSSHFLEFNHNFKSGCVGVTYCCILLATFVYLLMRRIVGRAPEQLIVVGLLGVDAISLVGDIVGILSDF